MSRVQLSCRLETAAQWVPEGAHLCDVGTDHATLPIWLLEQGRLAGAIATDIRPGPLDRARRNVERYGYADQVQLRLCDGLAAVQPGEVDTVTICGMGGKMMISILEAAPWTTSGVTLILQPMKAPGELRQWLIGHGYTIQEERTLWEEGHWYTLMLAHGGTDDVTLTPGREEAGIPSRWRQGDDWQGYLEYLLARLHKQRTGLERSEKAADPARLTYIQQAEKELTRLREQLMEGVWPL